MRIDHRIEAFSTLGRVLEQIGKEKSFKIDSHDLESFEQAFDKALASNAWFTPESVFNMLQSFGASMKTEELARWTKMYDLDAIQEPKRIAVVMAGNIPAVGFHDFLSVLMAGHIIQAKLSSDDKFLIPAIADLLIKIEPAFSDKISFADEKIKDFDSVIATGSNNTSRYFNYYFGKYPHIIRKNRNALAVLTGNETAAELKALGDDIFMYYGLGCRNISRLFVPKDYDLKTFFEAIEEFSSVGDHHKYRNNYDYNKSVFLINGDPHFDNGFLLLKEDHAMTSPVSVLHYERYQSAEELNAFIAENTENIQCVVSVSDDIPGGIPPGTAQHPNLWDYADGVDTMEFLITGF
ncbi:MAG: acyl-CoA reductase [Bacteroidetes bacterium]|nr:MAG: acyl-CoA reductase [Bacteroidota bacterium]